ncbi:hypothetical protein CS542_07615 [Pedobacter sp. IW39]|nr:hypothetical protein CS542_07615 [Pedobacter sp. IW39]
MLSSCKSPQIYEEDPTVYQTGDNKLWAEKTSMLPDGRLKEEHCSGIFWSRSPVKLIRSSVIPMGLHLEAFGASKSIGMEYCLVITVDHRKISPK